MVSPHLLEPNEVVGYRFRPDYYNMNVVVVKRKGKESKDAGQEYDTTLAHCKNLSGAVDWLFNHIVRDKGEELQKEFFKDNGEAASIIALKSSFEIAKAECLSAVKDLEEKVQDKISLSPRSLTKLLLNSTTDSELSGELDSGV